MPCIRNGTSGATLAISSGRSGLPNQFHMPSPAASRNTRANGSSISGCSLSVSAARAAATPNAVAPTLSVISQLSLSLLGTFTSSHSAARHPRRLRAISVSEAKNLGGHREQGGQVTAIPGASVGGQRDPGPACVVPTANILRRNQFSDVWNQCIAALLKTVSEQNQLNLLDRGQAGAQLQS